MTSIHTIRRAAGTLVVALALGIAAAPASARPIDLASGSHLDGQGSFVQQPTSSVQATSGPSVSSSTGPCSDVCSGHGYGGSSANSSSPTTVSRAVHGSDLEQTYLVFGGGVAALTLIGVGVGATVARRRHRRERALTPTVTA